MTRDDIIRMAREAGLAEWHPSIQQHGFTFAHFDRLERFAALVAAHERAACAAICDEESRGINPKYGKIMAMMIGERIRGRGDA